MNNMAKIIKKQETANRLAHILGKGIQHKGFGWEKPKNIWFFARLALPLASPKVGGGSVIQAKTSSFAWYYARLALPLASPKVGGGSVIQAKTSSFAWYYARLALPLSQIIKRT